MKKRSNARLFPQLYWIATTSVASDVEQAATWGPPDQVTSLSYPNAYFHQQKPDGKRDKFAANIRCHDDTILSVQANYGAYCRPRGNEAPYTHFEVSVFEKYEIGLRWRRFYPLFGTYGYVPLAKVEQLIRQHGGEIGGPKLKPKFARKLKKKLKNLVLSISYRRDLQQKPKSKDIRVLDAYNRTAATNSYFRLGSDAGQYRWWTILHKRVNEHNVRWRQSSSPILTP